MILWIVNVQYTNYLPLLFIYIKNPNTKAIIIYNNYILNIHNLISM